VKYPTSFDGQYVGGYWAGYRFKDELGYTTGKHTGVDWNKGSGNADLGIPVVAIVSGEVVARISNGDVRGFGNAIIIKTPNPPVSGNNLYHRYLHLNSVNVSVGQKVSEGQQIGTVGNTGTTYAHLHLDTWTDRNGLGAHWNYDKDTALLSYEDPYHLITNNLNWNGGSMAAITDDTSRQIGYHILGRNGFDGKPNALQSAQADIMGKELTNAQMGTFFLSAESRDWRDVRLPKVYAERDALKATNANLNTQITQLTKAVAEKQKTVEAQSAQIIGLTQTVNEKQAEVDTLADKVSDLEKENAELKAQLATCGDNEDTDFLNKLGELLRWLIQRLGVKK
jgi:uncharacterized coiled-coil protein SlyX